MGQLPPDYHIQHEAPPVFYCWKYWMTTGELHEGCTSLKIGPNQDFLDLNIYGWVYITVPLFGLFLLLFLFYCFCRGGSPAPPKKKALLSNDSESEDSETGMVERHPPRKAYAVPVRGVDAKNYYTMVPMDHANQRKLPMHGGVEVPFDPKHHQQRQMEQLQTQQQQQRLYPRLTAMRKQAGINGQVPQGKNGKSKQKGIEMQPATNDYHPDPTSIVTTRGATAPPQHAAEHHEDTSSEESEEEQ